MFESTILGLFIICLIICVMLKVQILYALLIGMFLFVFYTLKSGYSKKETFNMLMQGVKKIKNILIIFALIGTLTAVWRLSGTIPFIIYHSVNLIKPEIFVLCTFLLCSFMSFLIGTSLGTSGTMGVICMMISNTLGINPLLTGGAIMSGIYFGDRMSPMSSSAQLVSAITDTDIYINIKNMFMTSIVPFTLSCIFYIIVGINNMDGSINSDEVQILSANFNLNYIVAIPAALILILALFKVNVKTSMAISIIISCIIAVSMQNVQASDLIKCMLYGYKNIENETIAGLLNGGGIFAMVKVSLIVLVSSTYSGILSETKLLGNIKGVVEMCARKVSPFGATFITSIMASALACNQTLAVMLTGEICSSLYEDKYKLASVLENTAIMIAPLIFWNIAATAPLEAMGGNVACLKFAVYLYFIPIWNFVVNLKKKSVLQFKSYY